MFQERFWFWFSECQRKKKEEKKAQTKEADLEVEVASSEVAVKDLLDGVTKTRIDDWSVERLELLKRKRSTSIL